MDKMDLKKYGITGVTEIVYNPSYDELFREETKKGLRGFDKGVVTDMGAVNVMTGVYTGRSPKDKFFVMDETTKDTIWWTSPEYKNDNKPVTKAAWKELKKLAGQELSGKKLYVVDTFCGANENSRLKIRFIMEVAWQAHFVKNMFIRPTDAELEQYGEPDFVVLNASKAKVKNYKKLGLNSETAVVFNLTEKMQVIINTWYGGEMKKGMFSYMNYLLPLKGIASMHCSANTNEKGETAIFFGLSGTGKTTLSTDPKRQLIGDDEHGWDDDGVFNFEGGCYAKVINLSKENEPDIWNAIRRNALLENVTVGPKGKIDFADKSVTENTRVSYPIFHIENIVKPVSKAPAAKKVIFLSADAFGVLPPVSILTPEQTKYYFLSGFTAKLAGTERGITEPTPTFSACFGWFGIQAAVCGASFSAMMESMTGLAIPAWLSSIIWGIIMVASASFGFKGLKWLNYIAVPLLIIVLIYGLVVTMVTHDGAAAIAAYEPAQPLTLLSGINITVGSFAIGGSLAGDYCRFAKNRSDVIKSSVVGVLPSGLLILLIGAVLSIVTGEYDISVVLTAAGVPAIGLVALIAATWTTNVTNAYSGGLSLSNLAGLDESRSRGCTAIAGLVGTILAAVGIMSKFTAFLTLLCALIPAFVGVIIADYWIVGKGKKENFVIRDGIFAPGMIAFLVGAFVACLTGGTFTYFEALAFLNVPFFIGPINGLVLSMVLYVILVSVTGKNKTETEQVQA